MTNQKKIRYRFIESYGKRGEHLDSDTWLAWLRVYLTGWTDAEEQVCALCGDPIELVHDMCQPCYYLEMESDPE